MSKIKIEVGQRLYSVADSDNGQIIDIFPDDIIVIWESDTGTHYHYSVADIQSGIDNGQLFDCYLSYFCTVGALLANKRSIHNEIRT